MISQSSSPITRALLHWGIPVLCIISIFIAAQMGDSIAYNYVVSPFGFSENIVAFFVLIAMGYGIATLRLPATRQQKLTVWIVVFILAIFFFAGEDENWGQYWFGTEVPQYFLEVNKEKETNLHNINGWFNQKPRLMVGIWCLIACIFVPLGWSWPRRVTKNWIPAALWPDTRVVPLAIIAFSIGIIGRLDKHTVRFFESMPITRLSEQQEVAFAYLMLLFIALLYYKLRATPAA